MRSEATRQGLVIRSSTRSEQRSNKTYPLLLLRLTQSEKDEDINEGVVPEEPAEMDSGVVKLQIRMPNGKRVVRRFLETDMVSLIYKFVNAESGGGGKVELKAGFPPKSIEGNKGMKIGDAGLAGESIQARFV